MCNVGPTSYPQDSFSFGFQRVLLKRLEALSPQMDCYFAGIKMPLWVVDSVGVTFLDERKLFMLRVY